MCHFCSSITTGSTNRKSCEVWERQPEKLRSIDKFGIKLLGKKFLGDQHDDTSDAQASSSLSVINYVDTSILCEPRKSEGNFENN